MQEFHFGVEIDFMAAIRSNYAIITIGLPIPLGKIIPNTLEEEQQLKDINNVLQTAKAVPYTMDNKMKGFLIQTIEPDSPFASLGLLQGDVLLSANDVVFDNLGKGVEAFQVLRNARKIDLKVLRGGQEVQLSYEVK